MYICIGMICTVAYIIVLRRENAKREAGERGEIIEGVNDDRQDLAKNGTFISVNDAKREKGDKWSGYRYTL